MSAPAVVAPPAPWLWAYRLLGLRVPEENRAWVARDLFFDTGVRRLMGWRAIFPATVCLSLLAVIAANGAWAGSGGPLGALLGLTLGTQVFTGRNRHRVLRWQRVTAQGEPVREPTGVARLSNAGAVGASVVLLAFLVVVVTPLLLST